jgi:hypothetical protein
MTVQFTHSTVTARGGTARYQAPELFEVENPVRIHYGSDVYAFAGVCYEVIDTFLLCAKHELMRFEDTDWKSSVPRITERHGCHDEGHSRIPPSTAGVVAGYNSV